MALTAPKAQIRDVPSESPHYVRAVTELGEVCDVIVSQDIFATNGMKLVAKGAKISKSHFDRLTQHKLTAPLDHSLIAEKPVNADVLAAEVNKIIEHQPLYRRIATRAGDPMAIRQAFGQLKLASPLVMRLTVMQERRKEIFAHSVRCGVIGFCMAQRLNMPVADREAIILAALFHDVGEMHTDPALLATGHDITPEERKFVHVHPVTGYVLVHEMPNFPASAAQGILHHHERLDGSGYPNDLPGIKIPPLAKLIGVADVAEAVSMRYELARLDMLLRLNQSRFDPVLINTLRDIMHITHSDMKANEAHEHGAASQLLHLSELLDAWFQLRQMLEQQFATAAAGSSPLAFLFERMATIRQLVLQAGFDPDNMASMLAIAREDPEILLELREMLDEMDWLLKDLANEIDRRSPELAGLSPGSLKGLMEQLRG